LDPIFPILLAAVAVTVIYRLRSTYRKSRINFAKEEEIRRKLRELRKKRDEE
jgi:hypothetical protein